MSVCSIFIQLILIFLVMFFATFTGYELLSSGLKNRRHKNQDELEDKKLSYASNINDITNVKDITQVCNQKFSNGSNELNFEFNNNSVTTNKNNIANQVTCSILLPVCNEVSVIEQLITSVYRMEVPQNYEVEILLLDDSSEENSKIIKNIFDRFVSFLDITSDDLIYSDLKYRKIIGSDITVGDVRGQNLEKTISYYRRPKKERVGFKAGNISYGLRYAIGDFIVIFDADNIPPQDFLIKTLPYFLDDKVGFLQTAIEFRNRTQNFITRFLALETSHKDDITSNQSNSNDNNLEERQDFASLTGSSCIWRKTCLDSIGGFSSETLTEDIDLCYRAQLCGWQYVYAENVVSSEELPTSISGLRVQRHRWAYGLIRNAFLYTSKVLFAKDFSFAKKFKAFMLISQTFLLASFIVLLFLSLPLVFVTQELGVTFNISCTIFLLTTIVWGYNNLSTGKNRIENQNIETSDNNDKYRDYDSEDKPIHFVEYIGYILMYMPLSLYYFLALIENIFGIKTSFIPTEKKGLIEEYKIIQNTNQNTKQNTNKKNNQTNTTLHTQTSKSVVRSSKINFILFLLEIMCFGYAIVVSILSIYYGNWWTLLYGSICFLGFWLVICLSVMEHYKNKK